MIPADRVLIAFGFRQPQPWFAEYGIETDEGGLIKASADQACAYQTTAKIFAGGDMVRGGDLVVTACCWSRCGSGHQDYLEFNMSALKNDRFLRFEP